MFNKHSNKDTKESLLAQKQRLLQDLKYYKTRIEEAKITANKKKYVYDDDSSDSDIDLNFKADKSVLDLKHQQTSLKTSVLATQELTTVEVLQSEVNLLVESPDVPGVTENGVWKEVTAECSIDLVPFCITFFAHTPERTFAPTSYHKLQVTAVKGSHEAELSKSMLPLMTRPSDAIEIIRSYAAAYRSRRVTLARLVDKFEGDLNMEPIPEGGIRLKCANLLEVHWMLQNKWSPITPFQHRMVFDLEYMDEKYIKTIKHAHRQLSNPELETNERTLLLATIIKTCLEARGPTQELHDSLTSDTEGQTLLKKTTLTQRDEEPNMRKRREVMAPPKTVPKKSKDRAKRKTEEDGGSQKRMRTEMVEEEMEAANDDVVKTNNKNDKMATQNDNLTTSNIIIDKTTTKNDKVTTKTNNSTEPNDRTDKAITLVKDKSDTIVKQNLKNANKQNKIRNIEKQIVKSTKNNVQDVNSINTKSDKTSEVKKSVAKPNDYENVAAKKNNNDDKNKGKKSVKSKTNTGNTEETEVSSKNKGLTSKVDKPIEANKHFAKTKKSEDNANSNPKNYENVAGAKTLHNKNKTDKKAQVKMSVASSKDTDSLKNKNQVADKTSTKTTDTNVATSKNVDNKVITDANKQSNSNNKVKKALNNKETRPNQKPKSNNDIPQGKKVIEKIQSNKEKKVINNDKVIERTEQKKSKTNIMAEPTDLDKNTIKNAKKLELNKENKITNQNKILTVNKNIQKSNVIAKNKHGNSLKEKMSKPGDLKNFKKPVISKIPQIKSSPKLKGVTKKMPIRVSPRKQISAKSPLTGLKKTITSKVITNIPRLMTKPTSKISK